MTRRAISFLLGLTLLLSMPSLASAAKPPGSTRTDITAGARGQQLVDESADRFSSYGVPSASTDLRAIEFPGGHVVVGPAWLVAGVSVSPTSGRITVIVGGLGTLSEPRASDPGIPSRRASSQLAAAGAPYWIQRESGCLASLPVDSAQLDSCYTISQLINDGSAAENFYALRHKGTAYEHGAGLRRAWISGVRPANTTAQSWIDWSPEQSYDENCHAVPVSVSYAGVGIGTSVQQCEKWYHDKSCNTCNVYFKNTWDCGCFWGIDAHETYPSPIARAVAYAILVSVPSGYSPRWRLGVGLEA